MSFKNDLAAAKASGEPFSLSLNVSTGVQSITRYGAAELAALTSQGRENDDQRVAEQAAKQAVVDARSARLSAAETVDDLRQFIEDELIEE